MTYEVFQDENKKWRWKSISVKGKVCFSDKFYENKADCEKDIDKFKLNKNVFSTKKTVDKSFWQRLVDKIKN